jgi:membrane-bound serine protease (ClpP class)
MTMRTHIGVIVACAALALAGAAWAQTPAPVTTSTVAAPVPAPAPKVEAAAPAAKPVAAAAKVAVITVSGDIDFGLHWSLKRRIAAALDAGAEVLLFEMDTYGGDLHAAFEIGDLIYDIKNDRGGKVRTVAYVHKKAFSAGALISLACGDIIMRRGTTIGDCQPIMINQKSQSIEVAIEKFQTGVRAYMSKYAEGNGYPEAVCLKMVDVDMEVYRVKFAKGDVRYLTPQQIEELKPDEKTGIEKTLVLGKGKLLTVGDERAAEYGISRATVAGLNEAVARYGLALGETHRTNWSEEMVRFLNSMAVASLLLIVGLGALYMAFKTPGFGVMEIVAIICFATLFFSKYLVGLATVMNIVLFLVGVLLIAVEVFIIPGMGLLGIAGLVCLLTALVLSMQKFAIPKYDFETVVLMRNLITVFGSLLASTLGLMALVRYLPQTPFLGRLVLKMQQTPETGYVVESAEQRGLVGKAGVAQSTLRPSGRAEIDGQVLLVVTDGEFIEPGSKIVVAEVSGNRIVVRKA